VYQVLRHEAQAEWVDISEQTLLRELRREGRANPYADTARLKSGDPLVTPLARYRWRGEVVLRTMTKRALANSAARRAVAASGGAYP
jgi:hypothetical protein